MNGLWHWPESIRSESFSSEHFKRERLDDCPSSVLNRQLSQGHGQDLMSAMRLSRRCHLSCAQARCLFHKQIHLANSVDGQKERERGRDIYDAYLI